MKMSTGGIRTCLSYKYLRNKEVLMKETEKEWTEEVQPAEVLDAYKEMYGVEEAPKEKEEQVIMTDRILDQLQDISYPLDQR
jgi:isocitrate dehydrogenase